MKSPMTLHHVIYPTGIRVEKPPPNTICPDLLHSPTSVEEHGQHALPQVDYLLVLLRVCGIRGVVCHGVLLGYRGNDERRMEPRERFSE